LSKKLRQTGYKLWAFEMPLAVKDAPPLPASLSLRSSWALRYHGFLICKATWKWNELKGADER